MAELAKRENGHLLLPMISAVVAIGSASAARSCFGLRSSVELPNCQQRGRLCQRPCRSGPRPC
eukprot:4504995-Pyramimonas_sp.AAC.1